MNNRSSILSLFLVFIFSSSLNAQEYILGQGGTISTCGGTILDPGGSGNYPDGLNIIQTFCSSTPEDCIRLPFTEFALESFFDNLTIYEGSEPFGEILGDFHGSEIPQ